jgi:hypothetical protein
MVDGALKAVEGPGLVASGDGEGLVLQVSQTVMNSPFPMKWRGPAAGVHVWAAWPSRLPFAVIRRQKEMIQRVPRCGLPNAQVPDQDLTQLTQRGQAGALIEGVLLFIQPPRGICAAGHRGRSGISLNGDGAASALARSEATPKWSSGRAENR